MLVQNSIDGFAQVSPADKTATIHSQLMEATQVMEVRRDPSRRNRYEHTLREPSSDAR